MPAGHFIASSSCEKPATANSEGDPDCNAFKPVEHGGLNDLELTVTFFNIPDSVSVSVPELKYNKHGIINIEWDDNTRNALTGYDVMKNHTFPDGTGGSRPYTAAIGVNGFTFSGGEIGCRKEDISYMEYDRLIKEGWDLMNHSNRHVDIGHSTIDIGSYSQDLNTLNELYYKKTGYTMNCLIVPSDFYGFVPPAEQMGFLCSSSSGHNPYRLKHPAHLQIGNTGTFDDDFLQLNRDFKDDWSSGQILDVKSKILEIAEQSGDSVHLFYRLGTHGIDSNSLVEICNYIATVGKGDIWVTTAREWMEYRYLRESVIIDQTLTGNVLTLKVRYDNIPGHFRWGDLTLNIDAGSNISRVAASGEAEVSHNTNTINISLDSPYKSSRML